MITVQINDGFLIIAPRSTRWALASQVCMYNDPRWWGPLTIFSLEKDLGRCERQFSHGPPRWFAKQTGGARIPLPRAHPPQGGD